jgi:hypothetical protein
VAHWDRHNIQTFYKNKNEWFSDGDKLELRDIERDYKWISKLTKSKKTGKYHAPLQSLKVPFKNGRFLITVFDENGVPIEDGVRALTPGTLARCIYTHHGLWMGNRSLTNTNEIQQIQIVPPDIPTTCAFSSRK